MLVGREYCRSPLAQGVFEGVLRREGLEGEVFVDSAGTGRWHLGSPPDSRASSAAALRSVDISSQWAQRITPQLCQDFDYELAPQPNAEYTGELAEASALAREVEQQRGGEARSRLQNNKW